ncbi:hypothetical protein B0T10DRAFT_608247 [Thelonectria olida]|uniref:Uncharacterized protein n=1 Tax=Thelonectria olida TaxID=1576542 RepID=A0A9P8W069_9HYPO|nr:hypothetical protein B0T10DRAFT_608247 [Thelonectria olida]
MKFSVIITALVSAASVAAGVCAPCSDACAKSVKDDNPEIEYLHKCDCDNYNGVTPLRRSETRSLHEIPEALAPAFSLFSPKFVASPAFGKCEVQWATYQHHLISNIAHAVLLLFKDPETLGVK